MVEEVEEEADDYGNNDDEDNDQQDDRSRAGALGLSVRQDLHCSREAEVAVGGAVVSERPLLLGAVQRAADDLRARAGVDAGDFLAVCVAERRRAEWAGAELQRGAGAAQPRRRCAAALHFKQVEALDDLLGAGRELEERSGRRRFGGERQSRPAEVGRLAVANAFSDFGSVDENRGRRSLSRHERSLSCRLEEKRRNTCDDDEQ